MNEIKCHENSILQLQTIHCVEHWAVFFFSVDVKYICFRFAYWSNSKCDAVNAMTNKWNQNVNWHYVNTFVLQWCVISIFILIIYNIYNIWWESEFRCFLYVWKICKKFMHIDLFLFIFPSFVSFFFGNNFQCFSIFFINNLTLIFQLFNTLIVVIYVTSINIILVIQEEKRKRKIIYIGKLIF